MYDLLSRNLVRVTSVSTIFAPISSVCFVWLYNMGNCSFCHRYKSRIINNSKKNNWFLGIMAFSFLLLKAIFQKRKSSDPSVDVGNNLCPKFLVFCWSNGFFQGLERDGLDLVNATHWNSPTTHFSSLPLLQVWSVPSYDVDKILRIL